MAGVRGVAPRRTGRAVQRRSDGEGTRPGTPRGGVEPPAGPVHADGRALWGMGSGGGGGRRVT
eukprot:6171825-Pleurochrysis_carterae.AAC.1